MAGRALTIGGVVTSTRLIYTRDGRPFLAAEIEDLSGSAEVTVWPDVYDQTRDLWSEGQVVVLTVRVRTRNDRLQVSVQKAVAWEEGKDPDLSSGNSGNGRARNRPNGRTAAAPRRGLRITLHETDDHDTDHERLSAVVRTIEEFRGDDEVRLTIRQQDGDEVEIGANTAIDRGAMADTVVEQGCKIDNQVQIAHNVHVGAYTVIAGCAAISGSTKIGRYCIIGGAANFAGHLTIADRVTVSGGTSITKSITKPGGHFTSVFPFMPHGDWERNAAIVRGLTRMRERLQQLEQQVKDLKQQS